MSDYTGQWRATEL